MSTAQHSKLVAAKRSQLACTGTDEWPHDQNCLPGSDMGFILRHLRTMIGLNFVGEATIGWLETRDCTGDRCDSLGGARSAGKKIKERFFDCLCSSKPTPAFSRTLKHCICHLSSNCLGLNNHGHASRRLAT